MVIFAAIYRLGIYCPIVQKNEFPEDSCLLGALLFFPDIPKKFNFLPQVSLDYIVCSFFHIETVAIYHAVVPSLSFQGIIIL